DQADASRNETPHLPQRLGTERALASSWNAASHAGGHALAARCHGVVSHFAWIWYATCSVVERHELPTLATWARVRCFEPNCDPLKKEETHHDLVDSLECDPDPRAAGIPRRRGPAVRQPALGPGARQRPPVALGVRAGAGRGGDQGRVHRPCGPPG